MTWELEGGCLFWEALLNFEDPQRGMAQRSLNDSSPGLHSSGEAAEGVELQAERGSLGIRVRGFPTDGIVGAVTGEDAVGSAGGEEIADVVVGVM